MICLRWCCGARCFDPSRIRPGRQASTAPLGQSLSTGAPVSALQRSRRTGCSPGPGSPGHRTSALPIRCRLARPTPEPARNRHRPSPPPRSCGSDGSSGFQLRPPFWLRQTPSTPQPCIAQLSGSTGLVTSLPAGPARNCAHTCNPANDPARNPPRVVQERPPSPLRSATKLTGCVRPYAARRPIRASGQNDKRPLRDPAHLPGRDRSRVGLAHEARRLPSRCSPP